jgi:hypothetical protein
MNTYPDIPGFVRGSDTSENAASSMEDSAPRIRARIYVSVKKSGNWGQTCDELEILHGRHQTVSARLRELVLDGWIFDSGRRRLTRSGRKARVYLVVLGR